MTSTLIVLQIVLSVVITIAILLQKSSSMGLGVYSSSNESLFGAKGPMAFLAKFTYISALLFVVNTLALGYFYSKEHGLSVVDTVATTSAIPISAEKKKLSAPIAPTK